MLAYATRRVLLLLPVLILASMAVWGISYALPGSPANALAGDYATAEQVEAVEKRLGLDRPVAVQYGVWMRNAVSGDLGVSAFSGHSVSSLMVERVGPTAQLAITGILIGLMIALPAGIVAALRPRSLVAKAVIGYQSLGIAIPAFWLALLLILLLSQTLGWLPALSRYVPIWRQPLEGLRFIALPAITLGLHMGAVSSRFVAGAVSASLQEDYIRTARSKGLAERAVIFRHALPNALIPVVTIVGLQLGGFLGGTVVTEVIFNYPGLGRLIFSAVSSRDYALLQGAVLFVILIFLLVNLVVDLLYARLDPRVRLR